MFKIYTIYSDQYVQNMLNNIMLYLSSSIVTVPLTSVHIHSFPLHCSVVQLHSIISSSPPHRFNLQTV